MPLTLNDSQMRTLLQMIQERQEAVPEAIPQPQPQRPAEITDKEIEEVIEAGNIDWCLRTPHMRKSILQVIRDCFRKQKAITNELFRSRNYADLLEYEILEFTQTFREDWCISGCDKQELVNAIRKCISKQREMDTFYALHALNTMQKDWS